MQVIQTIDRKSKDQFIIDSILIDGQTDKFSILYNKYFNKVFHKSFSICKNYDDALDISQEIFIKVYSKLNQFEGRSSFSTWLFRITTNENFLFLRKKKKRFVSNIEDEFVLEDHSLELLQDKLADETKAINLLEILNQMSEDDKTILMIKYIEKKSVKETASMLNLNEAAAKMRLMRSRKRLLRLYQSLPLDIMTEKNYQKVLKI